MVAEGNAIPYNGSGVYSAPSNSFAQAITGTTIDSANWNTTRADIESALSNVICKDGQTTVTANLPMATYRHTGVSNATALTQYATADQVVDNSLCYGGASAAGSDTYAVSLSISPGAYAAGQRYSFIADVANTGACTVNFNGIGAASIVMHDGSSIHDNAIRANQIVEVEYNGTNMVLLNPHNPIPATANNLSMLDANGKVVDSLVETDGAGNITSNGAITATKFTGNLVGTILDTNDNEVLISGTTASAVNEVTVTNAATGNRPAITQSGSDDVGLAIEGVILHNDSLSVTTATIASRDATPRRVLIESVNGGTSTTIAVSSDYLTSTYSIYELDFSDVYSSTAGAQVNVQVYSGGAWQTADYRYGTSTAQAHIRLISDNTNSAIGAGANGVVRIYNPSSTSIQCRVHGYGTYQQVTTGDILTFNSSGQWVGGTGAVTRIRLITNAGTLEGNIKLYGVS